MKLNRKYNFTAFNAIFGLTLMKLSPTTDATSTLWNHNVRHFLDLKIYSKGFVNNKPVFDIKLTFIGHVSQFSAGGQDDCAC